MLEFDQAWCARCRCREQTRHSRFGHDAILVEEVREAASSVQRGWLVMEPRRLPASGVSGQLGTGRPLVTQVKVQIRRVYDEPDENAIRVLVDRIRPTGLTRTRASLDECCKGVAPSTDLLKWYGHDPAKSAEFARSYRSSWDKRSSSGYATLA